MTWIRRGRQTVYRFRFEGVPVEVHRDGTVYELNRRGRRKLKPQDRNRVLAAMKEREGGSALRTAWTWIVDAWRAWRTRDRL